MRTGDFSEVLAFPQLPDLRPGHGKCRRHGPDTSSRTRSFPANRISSIARKIQTVYPAPNNAGTNNGLQNNCSSPRQPKADRDNYDGKVNWNRTSAHQIWGKASIMDAVGAGPVLPRSRRRRRRKTTRRSHLHGGLDMDAEPDAAPRRQRRVNKMDHHRRGRTTAPTSASTFGIPGLNSAGRDGPRLDRSRIATAACRCSTPASASGQQRDVDAGVAQGTSYTASVEPDQGQRAATSSDRASTSCASRSITGSRKSATRAAR